MKKFSFSSPKILSNFSLKKSLVPSVDLEISVKPLEKYKMFEGYYKPINCKWIIICNVLRRLQVYLVDTLNKTLIPILIAEIIRIALAII